MSEIIKIALLGIAGVLFAIQFRQQRPEYTLLIGLPAVYNLLCALGL